MDYVTFAKQCFLLLDKVCANVHAILGWTIRNLKKYTTDVLYYISFHSLSYFFFVSGKWLSLRLPYSIPWLTMVRKGRLSSRPLTVVHKLCVQFANRDFRIARAHLSSFWVWVSSRQGFCTVYNRRKSDE